MIESCRVCLSTSNISLNDLTDVKNDEIVADILSFISGMKVDYFCLSYANFQLILNSN